MKLSFKKIILLLFSCSRAFIETTFPTSTESYEPCEKADLFSLHCSQTEFVISTDFDCEYFLFSRRNSNIQINAVSEDSSLVDLASCPHLYYTGDLSLHIPFGECGSFIEIESETSNKISYFWNFQVVKRNFYINEIAEKKELDQEETFLFEFKCGFENGTFLNTSASLNDNKVSISSENSTSESLNLFALNICLLKSSGACSSSELSSIKLGQLLRLNLDVLFETLDYRIESLSISSGTSPTSLYLVENGCVAPEFQSFVSIDIFAKEIIFESFAFANSQNIIFEVSVKACHSDDQDYCYGESDCDFGTAVLQIIILFFCIDDEQKNERAKEADKT
ncbi:unnamed protein product [Oikopleura dioica]|uniref:ZP domain-containing protein n=1 Tax=Oikopleura dioica TaxID=34765 RepID=E4YE02_OIKDI|nr:unnamed protein product [Oikopleura dioica]